MHDRVNDLADHTATYDCPGCGERRVFEQVLDLGEQRTDTDEWACTHCGTALFVDPALDTAMPTVPRQTRSA